MLERFWYAKQSSRRDLKDYKEHSALASLLCSCMLGVRLYMCGHFVCVCVTTGGMWGHVSPVCLHTHVLMPDCVFLCGTECCAHLCPCVSVFVHWCVCVRLLQDLCYSLSIVKESVEQDPDPPAGTNQTHSSGLNGQLTIREPLWSCLLVRHS